MPPSAKGVATDGVGFAKESGGLTTAAAAPAPSRRAKSRREIEIVFIPVTDRTISCVTRDRIAASKCTRSGGLQPAVSPTQIEIASSRLLAGIHAAIRFKDDPYAIETAQATALKSAAVSEKMADVDSASRCIFS